MIALASDNLRRRRGRCHRWRPPRRRSHEAAWETPRPERPARKASEGLVRGRRGRSPGFTIAPWRVASWPASARAFAFYFGEGFASIFLPDIVKYCRSASRTLRWRRRRVVRQRTVRRWGERASGGQALVLVGVWLVGALVLAALFSDRAEIAGSLLRIAPGRPFGLIRRRGRGAGHGGPPRVVIELAIGRCLLSRPNSAVSDVASSSVRSGEPDAPFTEEA